MSALLLAMSAWAGGAGVYAELEPRTNLSSRLGPLSPTVRVNLGTYWGRYRSSMQYGRYERLGLQLFGGGEEAFAQASTGVFRGGAGIEYGRGLDLLRVGGFWKASVLVVAEGEVEVEGSDIGALRPAYIADLTAGGIYWLGKNGGIVVSTAVGAVSTGDDLVFRLSVGVGVLARVGFLTRQKKLTREEEERERPFSEPPPPPPPEEPAPEPEVAPAVEPEPPEPSEAP